MTYSRESYQTTRSHEHTAHIEQAIQSLVADCDADAIFGTRDERWDYAVRVAELKSEITNDSHITSLDAGAYIHNLDHGVAERVGILASNLIESDQVTDEALHALSALPVPAPAFEKVLKDFYEKAVQAIDETPKASSPEERYKSARIAEDTTMVAITIAADIPEIKDGRVVVAKSGQDVHKYLVNATIDQAKKDSSKKEAVNSFFEIAHGHRIADDNPIINKMGLTAAAAALAGILVTASPVGAAHADAKIEKIESKESQKTIKSSNETVVLPAAAPAPDKEQKQQEAKPDKVVEIPPTAAVAPKTEAPAPAVKNETAPNTKTDTPKSSGIAMDLPKNESKSAAPASEQTSDGKDKLTPSPSSTQNESPVNEAKSDQTPNSNGNKSTNEQTDSKDTLESSKNKTPNDNQPPKTGDEPDSIKIDIPANKDKTESADKDVDLNKDEQDKNKGEDKILDHLKKDGPIAMSLDAVKKMTEERKDDEDEVKDDSKKPDDDAKIETIGQKNTQPSQKEKFNKEITKLIGGDGPIAMSLDAVKKMTEERKDDDKSGFKPRFEFAPSAEQPAPPKITTETYKGAPIPEHIIDPSLAGETQWSQSTLEYIRDHLDMYTNIEKQTGVEWEIMAALHVREASMAMANPANGQGIFQLFSTGEFFSPGPITKEEFTRQGILAANFFKDKARDNSRVGGPLTLSNPNKVKDTLFAYNGVAKGYIAQAAALGFSLGAEGSPYVMNLADDNRNNKKNPNWKQVLTDGGGLLNANQQPGAWVLIDGLMRIEQKAHDQAVAKQEAERKAAEEKAAADAAEAEKKARTISNKEVEPFNGWHRPVPANSAVSPQYPGHKGIDFAVKSGTPFYAAAGGVAKVIIYDDVRDDAFCIAAFDKLGRSTSEIKDPVQKEVRITRTINGDEYLLIYAHMSQIDIKDGDIVTAGQQIGKTGNSGCSTGDHAHFEVRKNGVAIDPNLVLNGAINVSSSEIKVSEDTHSHEDHEHNSAETVSSGAGAAEPSDAENHQIETTKQIDEVNAALEAARIEEAMRAIQEKVQQEEAAQKLVVTTQ